MNETPLLTPLFHEYVFAPPPVNVTGEPAHGVVVDADAVTVGRVFTVIEMLAVFVQPNEFVPVTVYDPEEAGTNARPLLTPLFQVYVEAPPPDNVVG
jgi:hypothetical protein